MSVCGYYSSGSGCRYGNRCRKAHIARDEKASRKPAVPTVAVAAAAVAARPVEPPPPARMTRTVPNPESDDPNDPLTFVTCSKFMAGGFPGCKHVPGRLLYHPTPTHCPTLNTNRKSSEDRRRVLTEVAFNGIAVLSQIVESYVAESVPFIATADGGWCQVWCHDSDCEPIHDITSKGSVPNSPYRPVGLVRIHQRAYQFTQYLMLPGSGLVAILTNDSSIRSYNHSTDKCSKYRITLWNPSATTRASQWAINDLATVFARGFEFPYHLTVLSDSNQTRFVDVPSREGTASGGVDFVSYSSSDEQIWCALWSIGTGPRPTQTDYSHLIPTEALNSNPVTAFVLQPAIRYRGGVLVPARQDLTRGTPPPQVWASGMIELDAATRKQFSTVKLVNGKSVVTEPAGCGYVHLIELHFGVRCYSARVNACDLAKPQRLNSITDYPSTEPVELELPSPFANPFAVHPCTYDPTLVIVTSAKTIYRIRLTVNPHTGQCGVASIAKCELPYSVDHLVGGIFTQKHGAFLPPFADSGLHSASVRRWFVFSYHLNMLGWYDVDSNEIDAARSFPCYPRDAAQTVEYFMPARNGFTITALPPTSMGDRVLITTHVGDSAGLLWRYGDAMNDSKKSPPSPIAKIGPAAAWTSVAAFSAL